MWNFNMSYLILSADLTSASSANIALRAMKSSINETAGKAAMKDILNSVFSLLYVTNPVKKYAAYQTIRSNMLTRHILLCLFLLLYVNIAAMDIVHVNSSNMNNTLPEKSNEPSDAISQRLYNVWSGIIVVDTNLPIGKLRHTRLTITEMRRYNVCLRCIISLWMFLWMSRANKY